MRVYAMPTARSLLRDPTFYVDVLSLVPFYLDVALALKDGGAFGASDENVPGVKMLRLLRLLRFLKLLRHYSGWRVLILAVDRCVRSFEPTHPTTPKNAHPSPPRGPRG